jgi:PAS domain S-box-containing protein
MLVLSYGMVRLSIEMDTRERTAQALKLSEVRQRLAVEAAGIGDWEFNLANHTTTRSLRHDQIFGYSQPPAEWSYETLLEHVHPEDRARVDQLYQQSLRQAGEWAVECRIRRLDGTTGWIWLRGRCFANQAGGVESVRGVIGDITERRAAEEEIRTLNASLEQRVRDRTEKLELAIKELDAFTYSVSHDLRAPLRAIDGFSRMVIEDYSGQLQGEAQRKLAVIRSEAQRMSRLIDDLLSFSRLGRAQVHPELIDMQALAKETFAELQELASNHRKIAFKVHPLPPAHGTQAMVRQVWTNLLSNALKFTRGREVTQIEIGSSTDPEGNTVYYIQDNGVGFDMRHVGKLFGVFQRLHSDKEFEGTGVGLALVQRIVTRHGGRVWAEAQQDKGATFFFTLPNSNV